MTEKLRKELYENAKRCYELLADKGVGNYALIYDKDYDEIMLMLDELVCGLSDDESEVYWD
jgi:hypothetical protein